MSLKMSLLVATSAILASAANAAPIYQVLLNDPVNGAVSQSGPDPLTFGNGLVAGSASAQLLTSFAQRTPTTPLSTTINLFGSGFVFNTIDLSALGPLVGQITLRYKVAFNGIDSIAPGAGPALVDSGFVLGYSGANGFLNGYTVDRVRSVAADGSILFSQRFVTYANGVQTAVKSRGYGTYSLSFNLDPVRFPSVTLFAEANCYVGASVATSAYCANALGFQSGGFGPSTVAARGGLPAVVPEPATFSLLVGGVIGLGIARRRLR